MNPKEFLNIVIEKFPFIKLDFERVRDFTDKISGVDITFGAGHFEWLSLDDDGKMHYRHFLTTNDISDEDQLREIVDSIFRSGVSVNKVYLTLTPDQPKEDNVGDDLLRKMGEEVAKEECQRVIDDLRNGENK